MRLQRLLVKAKEDHAKMGKMEKQVSEMENQVKLVNEVKDEAVSKADETRKENEQMRIEIKSLQSKVSHVNSFTTIFYLAYTTRLYQIKSWKSRENWCKTCINVPWDIFHLSVDIA